MIHGQSGRAVQFYFWKHFLSSAFEKAYKIYYSGHLTDQLYSV